MDANLAALAYLVSGVLFILALRGLSSPETSRQGNAYGMIGMTIAVLTTQPPCGSKKSGKSVPPPAKEMRRSVRVTWRQGKAAGVCVGARVRAFVCVV